MLLTLIAIAIATASLQAATDARAENGDLRETVQSQKELLATILNAVTGTEVTPEEAEVAESARASLGLDTGKHSNPGDDQAPLPDVQQLLTDFEDANVNDGGVDVAGSEVGTGDTEQQDGARSAGGNGPSRSSAIPKARKRARRSVPIQTCDCSIPNAARARVLNGCCCKRRANNTEIYNSTTIERFRRTLKGRAAGHYVACTPSQKDLAANRPAGVMIAYSLFRSNTKNIFIGDEEPWSSFPSSREAFSFDPLKATITIKQDGLYFIYAQVAHVLFTISSLLVNDNEWLRCQHRPPTNEYPNLNARTPLVHTLSTGRESCSLYGVRPLLAGDRIVIENGVRDLVAEVTQPHCSNIGIVKL